MRHLIDLLIYIGFFLLTALGMAFLLGIVVLVCKVIGLV